MSEQNVEAEARRWRFVRDHWHELCTVTGINCRGHYAVTDVFIGGQHEPYEPGSLDAAVDAAIAIAPGEQGWIERAASAAAEISDQLGNLRPQRDGGLELHHLKWMADELAAKRVGSETKCCRWLGWLQAGMVFHGLSTLDEEKRRNLRTAAQEADHG